MNRPMSVAIAAALVVLTWNAPGLAQNPATAPQPPTQAGARMPGQYGNARTTTRNQKLIRVDAENNLLLVRGAVPGPNGGYVIVKATNKL